MSKSNKIGIFFNENELNKLMASTKVETVESDIMMRKKSEIEAAFLNRYGVPGKFRISIIKTSNHTFGKNRYAGRVIFRLLPDDKRTRAILKAHPGWIAQFL